MSPVLSRPEFVALVAAFGIAVVVLDLVGRYRGVSDRQRHAALASVLGNGGLLQASVAGEGAFGVVVSPSLPGTAVASLYAVSTLCLLGSFVGFYRWARHRSSHEAGGA